MALINPGKRWFAIVTVILMSLYNIGLLSGTLKDLIDQPLLGGISVLTVAGLFGFAVAYWLYKMDL